MNPETFANRYGIFQLLAVFVFLLLLELRLRRVGLSLAGRSWIVALSVLSAGIGGRLHYVLEGCVNGTIPINEIAANLSIRSAGSTFFGAMGGVVLTLILLRRSLPGGSVLRLADHAVPGIGVAILLGRIGCLAQGCCLGKVCDLPWGLPVGLRFGEGIELHHPLPLYLGLWGLTSSLLATRFGKRITVASGATILLFASLFGLGRGILEVLRLGSNGISWQGSWGQPESFGLALLCLVVLLVRSRTHRSESSRREPILPRQTS